MCAKLRPFLLLILLLIGGNVVVGPSTPVVLEGPSPLNVSINAQANFSCVVSNTEAILWYGNDTNFDTITDLHDTHLIQKTNNSNFERRTVIFIVHESFAALLNNSYIKCKAITIQPHYEFSESSEVKLLIQGVMDRPMDISADLISGVVNITWQAPFILDNIKIYDYYINMTAYNSNGIIIHQSNVTKYENFTFVLVDQSSCTVYSSSVQARSDAGLGDAGMANMVNTFEVPRRLNASQIGVQVIFTEDDILLQFTIEQDNCTGQRAESISTAIYYNTDVISTNTTPADIYDDGSISIRASVPKSFQGTEVITIITLINRMGLNSSEPKLITIASTERVIFISEGSVVQFHCMFANFSDAKGCYVVFDCVMSDQFHQDVYLLYPSSQENSYISAAETFTCTFSSCSTYDIHAYDIAYDGSIGIAAWSEKNRALCSPFIDTSSPYMYSSPTISSTPDSENFVGGLAGILSVVAGAVAIICALLAIIVVGICLKIKGNKNGKKGVKLLSFKWLKDLRK